jgi:transposase
VGSRELARSGVTLQTLWVEYREGAARESALKPYEYSRFCDLYAAWKRKLGVVMRQVHRAGEKGFLDYSGKRPRIVDPLTGEVTEVELFVAVLGASNYTFAEATRTQQLADFVGSTMRAFEYFGCVPEVIVPDQLRSAVSGPHRYEPDINPTYLEMAQHYGVTVIPVRPRKPRDKAKVEGAVLLARTCSSFRASSRASSRPPRRATCRKASSRRRTARACRPGTRCRSSRSGASSRTTGASSCLACSTSGRRTSRKGEGQPLRIDARPDRGAAFPSLHEQPRV